VEEPLAQVFAPLNRVGNFAFLLFLSGIVVTIVVAFWFSYLLTRPIRILQKGAEVIGRGDFAHRVYLRTNDEIQQLAEELNTMAQSLQEAGVREKEIARMKSEFLSIAAHQLRTPLSALKWVLHMSLEGDVGKLTKKQKDLLQKGYESNERMITLVNDLLDVVRIEEGRFDYKFKRVEFVSFIEDVLEEMKMIAAQKKIDLTFKKPSGAISEITIDAGKLRLAFMNIVDNALQYTRAKGRVDVEIRYEDGILVTIQDTGIGISRNQIPRLFSKFFRADNAVRMQTSGSGLGLFIAKNIIEKHGGKIWIESEEGKGTTVSFTLPFSRFKK
jgi:two-component system sensor histidine kinase GlrK